MHAQEDRKEQASVYSVWLITRMNTIRKANNSSSLTACSLAINRIMIKMNEIKCKCGIWLLKITTNEGGSM